MIHKKLIPFIEMALENVGLVGVHFLDHESNIKCYISEIRDDIAICNYKSNELEKLFSINKKDLSLLDNNDIGIEINVDKYEIIFSKSHKVIFRKKIKKHLFNKFIRNSIRITYLTVGDNLTITFEENGNHIKTTKIKL